MAQLTENIWWIILAGSVSLILLIGLIIVSILISNKKLLRLQQEKIEEIQKSERMYADLFNNVSDLVYIHQFDGTILKINDAVESLLGYKANEIIGQKFQNVFDIPPSDYYQYIHTLDNSDFSKGILKLKSRDGKQLIFEYQNSIVTEITNLKTIRGIARNVTERIKAEEELKRKDKLLTAVADASILLLINPDHKNAINHVLQILGEAIEVDRVYVFENHIDPVTNDLLMSQKFEWCREGIAPQIDNPLLQNLSYRHPYAQNMYEKIRQGEIYSGIVRFMSEPEREIFGVQGIKSILIIPIFIGKRFWGFIGFDDCTYEREWSEVEKAVLKSAAGSIGGLIGLMEYEKELYQTNIFLSGILESSQSISIITTDLSGMIEYWNAGAENLFGYKAEEMIGQKLVGKIIDTDDKITCDRFLNLANSVITKKQTQTTELVFYNRNGNQLWVNLTISPIIDNQGNVIGLSSIGQDITQRKITELALIQNEEMFRNVWENSADGMRLLDEDAKIKLVNRAYCSLVQMPYEKLIGQDYYVCYYNQGQEKLESFKDNISKGNIPTRQITNITLWNGKTIPVEISNSFIELQNNKKMLLSIFRDISEQKEYERKIKSSEEKYRQLALHLQTIREEERTKIAREIHDELGQQLTGLFFEISGIKTMRKRTKVQLDERLDKIHDLIQQLISSVQRISADLRPAILDDLGLIPAIEWEVSQFQDRTKIKTKLNVQVGDVKIPKTISTVIFRILQESLTNVARHSKASQVSIDLKVKNDDFLLEVVDNGIGIPEEMLSNPNSIGLIGMRERAYSCNGELIIHSELNKGTKISLTIPINGEMK
ncbi:MAG: PAS domain S-box protein [Ignavibacteria bacterium]|nr:PAS domain S-box protein [Ignavibacteria bacterium]